MRTKTMYTNICDFLILILWCLVVNPPAAVVATYRSIGDDSNVSCDKEQHSVTRNNKYQQVFFNTLNKVALDVNMKSVVFIEDHGSCHENLILHWMYRNEMHINIVTFDHNRADQFAAKIDHGYEFSGHRIFVIATKNPAEVLDCVETCLVQRHLSSSEIFPHRTRWLVLTWTQQQVDLIKAQQRHSKLDNVAVVHFPGNRSSSEEAGLVWTFMWRENRSRAAMPIHPDSLTPGSSVLFPNTQLGFNGRSFLVLVQVSDHYHLRVSADPRTGSQLYVGPLMDILHSLSESLNFTYRLYPPAGSNAPINWVSFSPTSNHTPAHIGLIGKYNSQFSKNFEKSYPVFFAALTGLYRRPKASEATACLRWFVPFPSYAIYLSLTCGTLLFTAAFYATLNCCIYPRHDRQRDITATTPRRSDAAPADTNLVWTFVNFLGLLLRSYLNQSAFPRQGYTSACFLLGFWGLMIVCQYSIYSSLVTARTVKAKATLPFHTFKAMLSDGGYRWGTIERSHIQSLLASGGRGSDTMGDLRNGLKLTKASDNQSVDAAARTVLDSLPYKYVFIYYDSYLQRWRTNQTEHTDYVIMRDNLMNVGVCLVFRKNSELSGVISKEIIRFHDVGYLKKLYTHRDGVHRPPPKADPSGTSTKDAQFCIKLLIVAGSGILVVVSAVVLAVERILGGLRSPSNGSRSWSSRSRQE